MGRKRVTMATTTRALRWSAKAVGLRRRGPRSRPFSPTPPTLFDATITRLGGSGGGASCSFGVVAKAEESRSTTGALPEFVDTAIPKDVLEMFKEAQQRIIDLNQSRLHALEELAEARAKIIDLEERISAKEAAEKMKDTVEALPEGSYDDDDGKTFESTAGVISLLYETSWEPAFIHFNCPEQSSWTDSPGMKMKTGELPNHKIFSITASNLEFVLNNGDSEWDKPSYESNYFIGSPGSYILKKGKLEKIR